MRAGAAGGRPSAGRLGDLRAPREDEDFDHLDRLLGRIEAVITAIAALLAVVLVAWLR